VNQVPTEDALRRRIGSATLIAVLLIAGALALADNAGWRDGAATTGFRVVLAVTVVALLVAFVLFAPSVGSPQDTALGKPVPEATTREEIFEAYDEVTHSYSKETLSLLVRMLIDLPTYIVRISEEARIEESPLILMTTRQYYEIDKGGRRYVEIVKETSTEQTDASTPARAALEDGVPEEPQAPEKPGLLLIPLLRPEKGVLIDSFCVTDSNGCDLPTLSHNRVRGLLVYTLEGLLKIAIEAGGGTIGKTAEEIRKECLPTLAKIVAAVCSAGPRRKQSAEGKKKIEEVLNAIDMLPLKEEWREKLKPFCQQYIDYYVIVAEVSAPPGDHLILNYSYRVPCESPSNQTGNRWRSRFGLTPATFDLPVNVNAFQVDTYHLQISTDSGQYVYDHHLEGLDTRKAVRQIDLRKDGFTPYVRLYHDEGRPNAHLYIRRQGQASPAGLPRLKSVIQFREIPPGVLGAATVVSSASAALITFFALTHLGLGVDVRNAGQEEQIVATLNSDVPALLLALPAFTAALIGSWTDLSRVRRASLTTYIALAGTMILSIGSALHFVYDANHKLPTEFTVQILGDTQITTEWTWLMLMGSSLTLTLVIFRQWISESRHYFNVVRKRVDRQLS
jgi:hypothetical protein